VKLSDIIKAAEPLSIDQKGSGNKDPEILSIHYRSQDVKPGGLFVAIAGHTADGHDYIDDAIERGAVAVVSQKEIKSITPNIRVADTQQAGFEVGVIGTINYRYAGQTFDNPITTPESLDLQRILADMLRAGVSHVVMEASSHAIDLYRIRSCRFDVAVFINLSQDHLDFHGDMESYWASKKKLFTEYLVQGPKSRHAVAVINCDNKNGSELAEILSVPVIKTGSRPSDTVYADNAQCDRNGIAGEISMPGGKFHFKSRLVGKHNLENILCAAGVGSALNLPVEDLRAGIEAVSGKCHQDPERRYATQDYLRVWLRRRQR
jgi:UDP-N-acetylmuramyl tripeptide synthase